MKELGFSSSRSSLLRQWSPQRSSSPAVCRVSPRKEDGRFDGFRGSYVLEINGTDIGYGDFEYAGVTEYEGGSAFVIRRAQTCRASATGCTPADALRHLRRPPLFYNMTIGKNGGEKDVLCRFSEGMVLQTSPRATRQGRPDRGG